MPKQAKGRQPSSCQPEASVSSCVKSLPVNRVERGDAPTDSPAGKRSKPKTPLIIVDNSAGSGAESIQEVETHSSLTPGKSSKKASKLPSTNTGEETKIAMTESLPEVRAKAGSNRKGRVIPSRYKASAKNRAAATPTKMSDSSCISINQSKLFSTATSSTPVSAGGKVQPDVSIRPKQPPKMAALDATVRQRPPAVAAPGKDKAALKIKKSDKTATIKVKPLRAEAPAKPQMAGDKERVSEHQLLYNQYLQWTYLCRMSEAAIRSEQPQLSHQARQLSGLVDGARRDCLHLERKLQAVTVYREMAQLERQLGRVLADVNDSGDAVRADLSRLATSLDATRSRLQLKDCVEPADAAAFVEELVSAADRCRDALGALDVAASPHANLLQHTAEAVGSLQQALRHSTQHMVSSTELLQELSSVALQEASVSLTAGSVAQQ